MALSGMSARPAPGAGRIITGVVKIASTCADVSVTDADRIGPGGVIVADGIYTYCASMMSTAVLSVFVASVVEPSNHRPAPNHRPMVP